MCLFSLDVAQVNISPSTVSRRLKERDIHPRRAARKFFLSDDHTVSRLELSLGHRNGNEELWRRTIYPDENTFG